MLSWLRVSIVVGMKSSEIKGIRREIPFSPPGILHNTRQIWESPDDQAYFKASRHWLPVLGLELFVISAFGEPEGRQKIRSEFTEALGQPVIINDDYNDNFDTSAWVYPPHSDEEYLD